MPRGRAWTQQEISCLLALIKGSGEVTLLMASTSRPNEALWREISQGLAAAGYSRNVAQCRSKWKALKQAFYSEWETCRQAGGHSPRVPPHYKTMKKIWKAAGQPIFGERRLPDLVKLPPGKRRPRLEAQPPSSPGHVLHPEIPGRPPAALGQCTKSEPGSSAHMAEASQVQRAPSPVPILVADAGSPFAPLPTFDFHPALAAFPPVKQESAGREADSPVACQAPAGQGAGERALPVTVGDQGSSETTPGGEHPVLGDRASATDLQGPSVVSLLQSMQQLLVQILHTSQQQQVLLESLASDTVSHLHLISDNLVQVGETLHELLLQAHARSTDLPTSLSHYASHTPPLLPMVPRSPCTPNPPPNSPSHKEEPVVSSASRFQPHQLAPP
ncbi:TSC22 domain family protein 2-like [Mauremys mutica]|uniref:TSC22 domain family protein 2-like n=1 Tax=Mauremys mutica TaxID=74926 RepID=UPI001D1680D6|nr:TSC22 domain family protein 2-like [Mauremys mutica]